MRWKKISRSRSLGAPKAVPAFDEEGRCCKCGSKVSLADVTDTVLFAGDEIVKRYDGDTAHRDCVRCNYPGQHPDFKDYDETSK